MYRVRLEYTTPKNQHIVSTHNVPLLPQFDHILKHLQNVRPGSLSVYWREIETLEGSN